MGPWKSKESYIGQGLPGLMSIEVIGYEDDEAAQWL